MGELAKPAYAEVKDYQASIKNYERVREAKDASEECCQVHFSGCQRSGLRIR